MDRRYAMPPGVTAGARLWTTSVVAPRSRVGRLFDLGHDGDFEALDERLARRLYLGSRRAAQFVCLRLAVAQRLLGLPEGRDDDLAALRSARNWAPVNPLSWRMAGRICSLKFRIPVSI